MSQTGFRSGDDERFMQATLAYGRRGLGATAPNPCVAALVVKHGVVLARGITAAGGRPHAETQALMAAGGAAQGATLYVTLEPCSHHGHTKPCADAIVAAGVARVVIAVMDPDPRVSGRGVARLRQAGLEVVIGVCAHEARLHHLGHIRRVAAGRPAITLKLAQTADGWASSAPGQPRLLITGAAANAWVHMMRSMHDAVMVGIGTALADDPALTVRLPGMEKRQPARIVIDSGARLDPESRLAASAGETPLIVVTALGAEGTRLEALRRAGADIIPVEVGADGGVELGTAMRALGSRGLTRVFCEGGPRLGQGLLGAGLVDELMLLTSPDRFGGPGLQALDEGSRVGLSACDGLRLVEDRGLGPDRLRRYQRDV